MFEHKKIDLDIYDDTYFVSSMTRSIIDINCILAESLYFGGEEKFLKQMSITFPDFKDFVIHAKGHNLLIRWGSLKTRYKVSLPEFKKTLEKYCYQITKGYDDSVNNEFFINICPEYNLVNNPVKYYIHMSPVDNLDKIGIEPRSTNRFEYYSPRIYLIPLDELMDKDEKEVETISSDIYWKCMKFASMFNKTYKENKDYFIYLVKIPENTDVFIDNKFVPDINACYIFNKIVQKNVQKLCRIESDN